MLKELDLDLLERHPQKRLKPLRPGDVLTVQRVGFTESVVVRPLPSSSHSYSSPRYEILRGERWWRIAGLLGFNAVPAIIRADISDSDAAMIALSDDESEEDPISEARALRELLDHERMSITRLAKDLGRTRSRMSHLLRLLKLAGPVQTWVKNGQLAPGVARALVTLPHSAQVALAKDAIHSKLSARDVEQRAGAVRGGVTGRQVQATPHEPSPSSKSSDITHLETALSDTLGCRVEIDEGKLTIHYHNLEILDGVLERMGYRKKEEWD